MRLDKFLKVSRLIKRRTVAMKHVMQGAFPSTENRQSICPGDVIEIHFGEVKAEVLKLEDTKAAAFVEREKKAKSCTIVCFHGRTACSSNNSGWAVSLEDFFSLTDLLRAESEKKIQYYLTLGSVKKKMNRVR